MLFELGDALFHRDRIDNALALNAAQAGLNHIPFRAVHHDGHARNIGFRGNQIQETHHGSLAVQHGLVHVHVNDLCTVFHLLAGHSQSFFVLLVQDQAGKGFGASDVSALTHVDKQGVLTNEDGFQARQAHGGNRMGGSGSSHRTHLCEQSKPNGRQVNAVACERLRVWQPSAQA